MTGSRTSRGSAACDPRASVSIEDSIRMTHRGGVDAEGSLGDERGLGLERLGGGGAELHLWRSRWGKKGRRVSALCVVAGRSARSCSLRKHHTTRDEPRMDSTRV